MKVDALLEQERMSQAGANYRARMTQQQPRASQIVSGPDGQIYFADTYNKTVTDSGAFGPAPGTGAAKYDSDRGKAYQGIMSDIEKLYTDGIDGAVLPVDQWSEDDRARYIRARDALESGLYGHAFGGGNEFVMPPYVPIQAYTGWSPYEQAADKWDEGVGPGMAPVAPVPAPPATGCATNL